MTSIYYSDYKKRLEEPVFMGYLNILPSDIRQKILRYKNWEDAQASLLGKILLIEALQDMGLSGDLSTLLYNRYGRPYINDNVDFNISHSGTCVVCVISSTCRVGVDLEGIRPLAVTDFENQFTEEEWLDINTSPDIYKTFFFYWTAKEAVVKAIGKGLHIHLRDIRIMDGNVVYESRLWKLKTFELIDNYVIQIASDKDFAPLVNFIKADSFCKTTVNL